MVAKGHYRVEKGLLAFKVSNCDLAEACSATVPMERTTTDIVT